MPLATVPPLTVPKPERSAPFKTTTSPLTSNTGGAPGASLGICAIVVVVVVVVVVGAFVVVVVGAIVVVVVGAFVVVVVGAIVVVVVGTFVVVVVGAFVVVVGVGAIVVVVVVVVVVVGAFVVVVVVVVVVGAIVVVVVGAFVVVVAGANVVVVVVVGAFVVVVAAGATVVVVAIAAATAVVVTTAAGANPARTVVAGAAVTGPTPDVVVLTGTIVDETTVDEVGAMVDGIVDEGVKGGRAEVLESELPTTVVVDRMVEVAGKTVLGVWGIPVVDGTTNVELTGLRAVVVEFAGKEPEMGKNSVLVEPPEARGPTVFVVEVVVEVEVEVVVDWELAIGANCALTAAGAFGIPLISKLINAETVTTQTGATSLDNERSAQKRTNDWRYWANRNRR